MSAILTADEPRKPWARSLPATPPRRRNSPCPGDILEKRLRRPSPAQHNSQRPAAFPQPPLRNTAPAKEISSHARKPPAPRSLSKPPAPAPTPIKLPAGNPRQHCDRPQPPIASRKIPSREVSESRSIPTSRLNMMLTGRGGEQHDRAPLWLALPRSSQLRCVHHLLSSRWGPYRSGTSRRRTWRVAVPWPSQRERRGSRHCRL